MWTCTVISGRNHQRYIRAGDDNCSGGDHAANRGRWMARTQQSPLLHRRDAVSRGWLVAPPGVDVSVVRHYLLHYCTVHVHVVDHLLHF